MFDAVGGALDKASSLLGGDAGGGGGGTKGKPEYRIGPDLDAEGGTSAGPVGTNAGETKANTTPVTPPIEFIHFGRIHQDRVVNFVHDEVQDKPEEKEKIKRAIRFRNALERETLLLHGYIDTCQSVFTEYQNNRGVLGEIGAAADKLFGSGSSEPKPEELKPFLSAAAQAGGSVNEKEIAYPKVHKAGIDLHQARADFHEYAKKLETQYLGEGGGGKAALTSLPGAAKIAMMVQKIVFKMFDIYFATYLNVRREYEDDIEEACYQLTLEALKEKLPAQNFVPTYAIWFPKDKGPEAPPPPGSSPGGPLGSLIKPVTDAVDDVKEKINETKKEINDFIGNVEAETPPPAERFLLDAFKALGGADPAAAATAPNGDTPPPPPAAAAPKYAPDFVAEAFTKVLGIGELPGFVVDIIKEMTAANVKFLQATYVLLLRQKGAQTINQEVLLEIGRRHLVEKIVDTLIKMTSLDFLKSDTKLANIQGIGVSGKNLADKGKSVLTAEAARNADVILQVAIKDLDAKLNEIRAKAPPNGLTMEIFLARLPWLLSLMVRNTFFPIWDIIVEKVFGSLAGPLAGAMSPIKSALGTAKGVVDDAKEVFNKVNTAQQQLAQGVNQNNVGNFINNLTGSGPAGPAEQAAGKSFPGTPREVAGAGKSITVAEINEGKSQRQAIEQYIVYT